MRHRHNRAHAKAEQNPFFHPAVYAPPGGCTRIGLGSADAAIVQTIFELLKQPMVLVAISLWRLIEERLNLLLQHACLRQGLSTPAPREFFLHFQPAEDTAEAATPARAVPWRP